eukprot:scaffold44868_cov59-Attheya_sp.AAC.8
MVASLQNSRGSIVVYGRLRSPWANTFPPKRKCYATKGYQRNVGHSRQFYRQLHTRSSCHNLKQNQFADIPVYSSLDLGERRAKDIFGRAVTSPPAPKSQVTSHRSRLDLGGDRPVLNLSVSIKESNYK